MHRRSFLQLSTALGAHLRVLAETPMPMATLGKTGLRVSRITLGGYHMRVGGEEEAVRLIRRAVELGVNFFDSAAHYHKGESDAAYGKALAGGLRQKVLLMSKAQLRDRDSAMRQLEDTLRRMGTDYLDLWACHEVSTHEEVEKILAKGGAMEAFVRAKEQGKARHIGYTGHRDPAVLQRLLEGYGGWETAQHPVNLIDPHYLSFAETLLPEERKRGLGVLGMKSNAMGNISKQGVASVPECLRYAWSQDIDTLVSGVETVAQLEQNVLAAKTFQPMSRAETAALLARTKRGPVGSKVERYKRPEG
jgi:uncharacterized protein